MSSSLKSLTHCGVIASSAYKSLGLIRRTFSTHSTTAKKLLYLILVWSRLTYCSQLWRPHLLKDICTLERVQRRATKYILNDYSSFYKSRLVKLDLLPLMYIAIQTEVTWSPALYVCDCILRVSQSFFVFTSSRNHTKYLGSDHFGEVLKVARKNISGNSSRHHSLCPMIWQSTKNRNYTFSPHWQIR